MLLQTTCVMKRESERKTLLGTGVVQVFRNSSGWSEEQIQRLQVRGDEPGRAGLRTGL